MKSISLDPILEDEVNDEGTLQQPSAVAITPTRKLKKLRRNADSVALPDGNVIHVAPDQLQAPDQGPAKEQAETATVDQLQTSQQALPNKPRTRRAAQLEAAAAQLEPGKPATAEGRPRQAAAARANHLFTVIAQHDAGDPSAANPTPAAEGKAHSKHSKYPASNQTSSAQQLAEQQPKGQRPAASARSESDDEEPLAKRAARQRDCDVDFAADSEVSAEALEEEAAQPVTRRHRIRKGQLNKDATAAAVPAPSSTRERRQPSRQRVGVLSAAEREEQRRRMVHDSQQDGSEGAARVLFNADPDALETIDEGQTGAHDEEEHTGNEVNGGDDDDDGDSFIVDDDDEELIDDRPDAEILHGGPEGLGAHFTSPVKISDDEFENFTKWVEALLWRYLRLQPSEDTTEAEVERQRQVHAAMLHRFGSTIDVLIGNLKSFHWVTQDKKYGLLTAAKVLPGFHRGLKVYDPRWEDEAPADSNDRPPIINDDEYIRLDWDGRKKQEDKKKKFSKRPQDVESPLFWGQCGLCGQVRAHVLQELKLTGRLPDYGRKQVVYYGGGGCASRFQLFHVLLHFQERLMANLKKKLKAIMRCEQCDAADAFLEVMENRDYLMAMYCKYKELKKMATWYSTNADKQRGRGNRKKAQPSIDVTKLDSLTENLHADPEAAESDVSGCGEKASEDLEEDAADNDEPPAGDELSGSAEQSQDVNEASMGSMGDESDGRRRGRRGGSKRRRAYMVDSDDDEPGNDQSLDKDDSENNDSDNDGGRRRSARRHNQRKRHAPSAGTKGTSQPDQPLQADNTRPCTRSMRRSAHAHEQQKEQQQEQSEDSPRISNGRWAKRRRMHRLDEVTDSSDASQAEEDREWQDIAESDRADRRTNRRKLQPTAELTPKQAGRAQARTPATQLKISAFMSPKQNSPMPAAQPATAAQHGVQHQEVAVVDLTVEAADSAAESLTDAHATAGHVAGRQNQLASISLGNASGIVQQVSAEQQNAISGLHQHPEALGAQPPHIGTAQVQAQPSHIGTSGGTQPHIAAADRDTAGAGHVQPQPSAEQALSRHPVPTAHVATQTRRVIILSLLSDSEDDDEQKQAPHQPTNNDLAAVPMQSDPLGPQHHQAHEQTTQPEPGLHAVAGSSGPAALPSTAAPMPPSAAPGPHAAPTQDMAPTAGLQTTSHTLPSAAHTALASAASSHVDVPPSPTSAHGDNNGTGTPLQHAPSYPVKPHTASAVQGSGDTQPHVVVQPAAVSEQAPGQAGLAMQHLPQALWQPSLMPLSTVPEQVAMQNTPLAHQHLPSHQQAAGQSLYPAQLQLQPAHAQPPLELPQQVWPNPTSVSAYHLTHTQPQVPEHGQNGIITQHVYTAPPQSQFVPTTQPDAEPEHFASVPASLAVEAAQPIHGLPAFMAMGSPVHTAPSRPLPTTLKHPGLPSAAEAGAQAAAASAAAPPAHSQDPGQDAGIATATMHQTSQQMPITQRATQPIMQGNPAGAIQPAVQPQAQHAPSSPAAATPAVAPGVATSPPSNRSGACYYCGMPGHWAPECPRIQDKNVCFRCKQPGHWAHDCPRRR